MPCINHNYALWIMAHGTQRYGMPANIFPSVCHTAKVIFSKHTGTYRLKIRNQRCNSLDHGIPYRLHGTVWFDHCRLMINRYKTTLDKALSNRSIEKIRRTYEMSAVLISAKTWWDLQMTDCIERFIRRKVIVLEWF